ncbi:tegument protein VP13/14 [Pteropodid alphaherpesvirus 1]|uniref:Tegument protein UL47 n=1 Tax=Pteropodid alphaherpesvirus 1 TaxID=1343901 RepID=A0A060Q5A3_9ALPH|nr:tegument protein VP13/14 [Pteropodid alphaherpesvirus 1]BAP00726.1 tegument protein VP13/14 [Pteropodid alphaherpesvirus 1]
MSSRRNSRPRRRSTRNADVLPAEDASPMEYESADQGGAGFVGYLRSVFRFGGEDPEEGGSEPGEEPPRRRRRQSVVPAPLEDEPRRQMSRRGSGHWGAPAHDEPGLGPHLRGRRHSRRSSRPSSQAPGLQVGYLGTTRASELLHLPEPLFVPSELFLQELEFEEADYKAPGPADSGAAGVEFLEGRLSRADILDVFPLNRLSPKVDVWDESLRSVVALGHPACLYPCPHRAFSLARVGDMHFASPLNPATFFRRTLQQGEELAWFLTGDSLRESTERQLQLTPHQGLSFLMDALARVAANSQACGERLHAEVQAHTDARASELRRQFARVAALHPLDPASIPRLPTGGAVSTQTGPAAAALRSSLGSLVYWADLRTYLDRECRVAARFVGRMTYLATSALLARVHPDTTKSILTREAAFLGRALDVLAVLAEQTLQWITLAVGAQLHPHSALRAFRDMSSEELFRALPLGSPAVLSAEAEALGDTTTQRLIATSGLNTVLAAAVFAIHTALTTVFIKHAQACKDLRASSEPAAARRHREEKAATRALLAAGLILQRLLGLADTVVACLAAAAFDGGLTAPDVGAYTPLRYACVLRVARPLYSRTTPSQFWADVQAAAARIHLRPVASAPPEPVAQTVEPVFLLEDLNPFPQKPLSDTSVLGPRSRVVDIMSQFRRLLMGDEDVAMLQSHLSGHRAAGLKGAPPTTSRK